MNTVPSQLLSLSRREFLRAVGVAAGSGALVGCIGQSPFDVVDRSALVPTTVNDIHSQLNLTRVAVVLRPQSESEVAAAVRNAIRRGEPVAVSGGRHAAGGQQFLRSGVLVDLTGLETELQFNPQRGLITMSAGTFWPAVIAAVHAGNVRHGTNWAIHQKQGGADAMSLGGAVSANVHGRCLDAGPIVQDIESLRVVLADGRCVTVSRGENGDLFHLIMGGYGLFAIVTRVMLRLVARRKLALRVEARGVGEVIATLEQRRRAGAVHGDWQFAIDRGSDEFLGHGFVTSYSPVGDDRPITRPQATVDTEAMIGLATLAHVQPGRAFEVFAQNWKQRDGQVDWSDSWQAGDYHPDYHSAVDARLGSPVKGTEVLSEFYVARPALEAFMRQCASWLKTSHACLVYGVVRLIRRDTETFLNWAREDQACVILNLHVDHTSDGIAAVKQQLHGVAQIAVELGGRFYLTYGRFADRAQLVTGYPQLREFLHLKRRHDPSEILQSDWYRSVKELLGEG